jgi:hypothetical protein
MLELSWIQYPNRKNYGLVINHEKKITAGLRSILFLIYASVTQRTPHTIVKIAGGMNVENFNVEIMWKFYHTFLSKTFPEFWVSKSRYAAKFWLKFSVVEVKSQSFYFYNKLFTFYKPFIDHKFVFAVNFWKKKIWCASRAREYFHHIAH